MTETAPRRRKIAILGGGVGALTTAYWLTEKPGWGDEYEITVYQMGWRLGGKGASGRNLDPKLGARIEEHGLHIWFGCYENAFRTIKRVLDQLHALPEPPVATFASWREAFAPHSLVVFGERAPGRTWRWWDVLYPSDTSEPGTGGVIDFWPLLQNVVSWLLGLRGKLEERRPDHAARSRAERLAEALALRLDRVQDGIAGARHLAGHGALFAASLALHALERLALAGRQDRIAAALVRRVRPLLAGQRRQVRARARRTDLADPERTRFWILTDLGLTTLLGLIEDDVAVKGWESIDREDLRGWLTRHGASPEAVNSTLIETFYDLAFAYEDGDTRRPSFAAGTALCAILRVCFTYNGALMYEMRAGMGDTIFTPLFGLLRERGVRFEFFHRVEGLELDRAVEPGDPPRIGAIRIQEQATVKPEVRAAGGYWPLVRVGDLDCWPSEPDWSQLVEGRELRRNRADPGRPHDLESYWSGWKGGRRKRLVAGRDFDEVVFGLSLGAVPVVCKPLLRASERWRRMLDGSDDGPGVKTARTQGVQLWFRRTTEALGFAPSAWVQWHRSRSADPLGATAVLGGYEQPLDTWADLTHLLEREAWRGRVRPASLAYLCGPFEEKPADAPFSDHDFPRRMREEVERRAIAWLERFGAGLWPGARSARHPTGVDPRELHDPWARSGVERFRAQFYRANVEPTERYVLSVAGSTQHRLDGVRCGFANLYLAGDWTRNPVVSVGCVEAATASGMQVARALGRMDLEIVGEREQR